jgi:hypothetical protein
MMAHRTIVFVVLAAITMPALAQDGKMEQEIHMLRTYCGPDIERLCPNVEPGGGRIKACLRKHKEQMSVGCARALQKLKKK